MSFRSAFAIIAIFTLFTAACSDDSSEADAQTSADLGLDAAVDTLAADNGQSDAQDDDGLLPDQATSDAALQPGVATDVQLGLHDNNVKIKLSTMEVLGNDATDWDLYMSHGDPVDQLPHLELGPGVTAQNLGNTTAFHDVATAPETGYLADDPTNQTYIIGSSWRNGGSGTTGFVMTGNIYAIKCAGGQYAKIEVLSAQSGEIHVLSYYQPDGSTNLQTAP